MQQNAKQADTGLPADLSLSNSAQLSMLGSSSGATDFDAKMMARMQSFRDAQLPKAEAEADRLAASVRPGSSLSDVKAQLGMKLGADFSNVRIHTGEAANDMASSIGAEAYTSGKDIYLGEGASAETAAHELVHTIQQGEAAGIGVSESVASGTVQMKPGKFSRLKHWFRKTFDRKKETPKDAPTPADPYIDYNEYHQPHITGTNVLKHQGTASELERLEYFHKSDSDKGAAEVIAGEHDDVFDDMDDKTKVDELHKLALYLSSQRQLLGDKEFSEKDKALERTYLSVMQKSSGSDSFMKTMMAQLSQSAADVNRISGELTDAHIDAHTKRRNDKTQRVNNYIYEKAMEANEKADRYDKVVRSDEGRKFNALRFMLNDATDLMTDGKRRNQFNELRRLHFSKVMDEEGKEVVDAEDAKRVHAGQMKTMDEKGNINYSDVSGFVSNVYNANSSYSRARGLLPGSNYSRAKFRTVTKADGSTYQDVDYGDMAADKIQSLAAVPAEALEIGNMDLKDAQNTVAKYKLPSRRKK